jgi:hypothetical protein
MEQTPQAIRHHAGLRALVLVALAVVDLAAGLAPVLSAVDLLAVLAFAVLLLAVPVFVVPVFAVFVFVPVDFAAGLSAVVFPAVDLVPAG